MNRLRLIVTRFISIFALFGIFSAQGVVFASRPVQQSDSGRPLHFKEVPSEVRQAFAGGMSIDRFLALNGGRVPQALEKAAAQQPVSVVIEMDAEPLAAFYAERTQSQGPVSAAEQQAYNASLVSIQEPVAQSVESVGGHVIAQYTKAYNGLLVRVPLGQLQALLGLPGVEAVHPAPRLRPTLAHSVPLIRATQVIEELGIDGTGVSIAIIDTGIDYTHAAFGGPGDPTDYENNDPDMIEPGTFPTVKVIGGYDFAGTNYDAGGDDPSEFIPNPDADPLDENGHGTHVASIAAGEEVSAVLSHGVAPGASLYALKVFGAGGSTELHVNAIEWSLDPNQDNDLSDHVDVINMSLGSHYGIADLLDPGIVAVEYATDVGIVVVASAGNAGDVSYITDTPAAADSAISVAASTTGWQTGPSITLENEHQIIYNAGSFDDGSGHFETPVTAELAYVGDLFENDLLCEIPDDAGTPLDGKIALIQRGECDFSTKINNAATLGAVAAIIFNHETGGNTFIGMIGISVDIPAGFVRHDDGLLLIDAAGQTVTISAETDVITLEDPYLPADTIADFSSRGPRGLDAFQKPDVTAPGVAIFAAAMGSGDQGTSFSGTSMASPHVAGVAALVLEDHPDWVPEQIKAAIMNTAVDLVAGSAAVPRQGAGRVDAYRAVTTEAFAIGDEDQVSLSWGILDIEEDSYQDTKALTLHDLSDNEAPVYNASVEWGEGSLTAGVTVDVPPTIELADRRFANIEVNLTIDATQVPEEFMQLEEYYGYVVLTNPEDESERLRVPFYLIPQPYSQITFGEVKENGSIKIEIEHEGPIASSLWGYPLYEEDENELEQEDMADLRMVGLDYGFNDETYGDIFIPAINTYGPWFTPQPYFAEFDLYLDVDDDDNPDIVDFNWNYGQAFGTGDDDTWVVVQVDLSTATITLGSPYLIYTDYNSGYMEWALPAEWHGLSEEITDFNWQLFAFDALFNQDSTQWHYFDIAHPPFEWELSNNPGPENPVATFTVSVRDEAGMNKSNPIGLMLVDYNGRPGEGQAYAADMLAEIGQTLFLPIINR